MYTLLTILWFVCPIAAVGIIVRLVCATYSKKILDSMRRHPGIHWIWGGFALLSLPLYHGFLNPVAWPPPIIERREQRQEVLERVETAGGWDAIRRECMVIAEKHKDGFFSGYRDTNLPPAIFALKPLMVKYNPQFGRVSMRIFGMHSTGGHSTPYFGLEVAIRRGDNYQPDAGSGGGVIGNRRTTFRKVADGIYEIY